MKILALDLSLTATGWATSLDEFGVYRPGDLRGVERLDSLYAWIWGMLVDEDETRPDLVLIEGYSYGSKGQSVFNIAEWGGIARLCIHRAACPLVEVPPQTLKKYATGRGNATKPDMRMELYKRSGLDVADDNAVDALWLLAIGRELVGDPLWDMPKTHMEALKKVAASG